MSCQVIVTAKISDVGEIRRCLFPTDDQRGSESWLHLCEISISPTGDLIAIAREKRLVILIAKWDIQTSTSQYQIAFSGLVHQNDNISAVLCLPVVGQSHSSQVGPDWGCILLGYDSGYIRFYTDTCDLLIEEQLHNEPVISIKCQSQHSPRPDISLELRPEEIYVQYQSNVCILSGNQVFPTLRDYRNQLARARANTDLKELLPPFLNSKKWGFQDQSLINDCSVVGLNLVSSFDHLLTASTCGGFETKYRAMPPHNSLVLAAGAKPFLGFQYAVEGGAQPVLSDVAKAMASKLKSALPSWLTGQKSQPEKQMTTAMQPAEAMGCRFGLCDLRRVASKIVLSPDRKLAAVSDALGRVLLIDTNRGVAVSVFKGYREAQCAFVQVPDERKSNKHRIGNKVALFLLIYSPKKGTLEIFCTQLASKVATFTASKYSRLLHMNYGLMGFSSTSKSKFICQVTTALIDNDGLIKEIVIPFHFALAEKNNKRAKDIHLYKKLRTLIKCEDLDQDRLELEAYNICAELKTLEMKRQMLEMLITARDIGLEVRLKCINHFVENCEENLEEEGANNFKILSQNISKLLNFYKFVSKASEDPNGNIPSDSTSARQSISSKELNSLQKLVDLTAINDCIKTGEVKVSFFDNHSFDVTQFIAAFDTTQSDCMRLRPTLDETIAFKTSETIFKTPITKLVNFDQFEIQVRQSSISPEDLFYLLITYWVNRPLALNLNLESEMDRLSCIIQTLAKSVEPSQLAADYNATSKFWSRIRDVLKSCKRPFPALTAAILCKYIAQKLEREQDMDHSTEMENLEVLSQENCEWTLLIGKLEDVTLLNIVLANKPVASDCTLPKLKHSIEGVSLKYVLDKGKGSVSELVAQWLTISGVNPNNIVLNDAIHKMTVDGASDSAQDSTLDQAKLDQIKSQLVFDHINLMRVQFPYSLEATKLLANMCWEYSLEWQKHIQNLSNLEASIKCLREIPDVHVKQGMYNLVWNTNFKILFESSSKLINKVGKLPKEKMCQQDTGLSDYQITLFIAICTNFLDDFGDVVCEAFDCQPIELHFEPIWDNGPLPLVELALQQNYINYDLLHVHYQLSLVLHMITSLSVKHSKAINHLFHSQIVSLFLTDLQKNIAVNYDKTDDRIDSSRIQFLTKVISASIESITVNEDKIFSTDHVSWMSKCLLLGRTWNLDLDLLRRYQVVQLFANGFDSLAEELVPAVTNSNKIGLELLNVAGKRVRQLLTSSSDLGEHLSVLSPTLTKYLDTLNGDWCAPASIDKIISLTTLSVSNLDEAQSEHKLALLLLEACSMIRDLQCS